MHDKMSNFVSENNKKVPREFSTLTNWRESAPPNRIEVSCNETYVPSLLENQRSLSGQFLAFDGKKKIIDDQSSQQLWYHKSEKAYSCELLSSQRTGSHESISRQPSWDLSRSPSRLQSFTFAPPSRQGSTFFVHPTSTTEPTIQRTTSEQISTPDSSLQSWESWASPHYHPGSSAFSRHGLDKFTYKTKADILNHQDTNECIRPPCLVGWAEVENAKSSKLTKSMAKIYRCTYCNGVLENEKHYVATWPEVLFCNNCRRLPQCHGCQKKAVQFMYRNKHGNFHVQKPLLNFGGLSLCGQCAMIDPVCTDDNVKRLVHSGQDFLRDVFDVEFTPDILNPQIEPEVASCLAALQAIDNPSGECTIKVSPAASPREPITLKTDKKGHVIELPFNINAVPHIILSPSPDKSVYGRCETRTLTFPPHPPNEKIPVPPRFQNSRVYRVVQKIMVSKGVPEGLFYGHLVHEMLHAFIWLVLDGSGGKIDLCVEEGLCNCIMAACIQQKVECLNKRREIICKEMRIRGLHPQTRPTVKEVNGISQPRKLWKFLAKVSGIPEPKSDISERTVSTLDLSGLTFFQCATEYELKILNRRLGEMERDRNPAYGTGYRTVRQLLHKLSLLDMVKLIGKDGQSLESTVRAALISVDGHVNEMHGLLADAQQTTLLNPVLIKDTQEECGTNGAVRVAEIFSHMSNELMFGAVPNFESPIIF